MRRRKAATAALVALLDRSLTQIASAAADARTFDRETIALVSDVWDNNTFPLFRALMARTSWGRERRARAALAWMAALGSERRRWMVEQAAIAGHPLADLLPKAFDGGPYYRDYLGRVRTSGGPLTEFTAQSLAADYDLATAEVRFLLVERLGTRLIGNLIVVATRRYHTDMDPGRAAELTLQLEGVTKLSFDSGDASGVSIEADATGVAIGIGTHGRIWATAASGYYYDDYWHASSAGRAAEEQTPPRATRPRRSWPSRMRRRQRLDGYAFIAAWLLREAMLKIRGVRYAPTVDRIPVRAFCRTFAGAGEAVLAAANHHSAKRRQDAFRRLIDGWVDSGGADLAPWFAEQLRHFTETSDTQDTARSSAGRSLVQAALPAKHDSKPVDLSSQAELRLARYSAYEPYQTERKTSAVVHLALPPGSSETPWRLRVFEMDHVARFHVEEAAFGGLHHFETAGDRAAIRRLTQRDDDRFSVSAED